MFNIFRRRRLPTLHEVTIDAPADILPYLYWAETDPVRFFLPTSMLCTQQALRYGPEHPFVQALAYGPDALRQFYAAYQPDDLAAAYGLQRQGRLGENLPAWEIPWIMLRTRQPPKGEHRLPASHGFALYGPVTEEKITLEMSRLNKVASSIARRGYDASEEGGIQGHFLANGDEILFFVKGGKHRAAALVHAGYSHVPVTIRRTWPPVVHTTDMHRWPLVLSGDIAPEVAADVMAAYFAGPASRARSVGMQINRKPAIPAARSAPEPAAAP